MLDLITLAAEGPGERSPIETILPPAAELFWGAVAFALVYLIIARFAFPKINELLEERAASIQGKMQEADQQLEQAQQRRSEYEQRLSEADREAQRIVDEARDNAENVRREIIARAESEAEQVVQRAQNEAANERDRTVQALRSEVSRLAVQLAEKIVQREIDERAHQDLIDRYIDRLRSGDGATPADQGTSS